MIVYGHGPFEAVVAEKSNAVIMHGLTMLQSSFGGGTGKCAAPHS